MAFSVFFLSVPFSHAAFDPDLDDTDEAVPATPATSPVIPSIQEGRATPTVTPPVERRPQAPYQEKGPRELKFYVDSGRTPNYLRIDAKNTRVRTSPDFDEKREDNVESRTEGGELYAVERVEPMNYGAAVQVHVGMELRWVYVPYAQKEDFQFCESEACFTAMARSFDFLLRRTGVSVEQAQSCGITEGPEGLVLPKGAAAPRREPQPNVAKPKPMPAKPAAPTPEPAPRGDFRMSAAPAWERARGAQGTRWTQMLSESLDKWGKNLLDRNNLSDAKTFCPNFSRLSRDQKKEFWIHLFNGIAQNESNFKLGPPAFDEKLHRNIYRGPIMPNRYSMGLFQLSYGSAGAYRPGCRIDWRRDQGKTVDDPTLTISDAKIQMDCAVTAMNKLVGQDGAVGLRNDRGGARFWSTLRLSNPATTQVIHGLKRFGACWR